MNKNIIFILILLFLPTYSCLAQNGENSISPESQSSYLRQNPKLPPSHLVKMRATHLSHLMEIRFSLPLGDIYWVDFQTVISKLTNK